MTTMEIILVTLVAAICGMGSVLTNVKLIVL